MQFCPKCGSLILPKKDGGKTVVECKCGYKAAAKETVVEKKAAAKPTAKIAATKETVVPVATSVTSTDQLSPSI